eukprot:67431_1
MLKLLVVCFISIGSIFAQISPILYVSSNGTDVNNFNCSKQTPCATLRRATWLRQFSEPFMAFNNVHIFIDGINSKKIQINTPISHKLTMSLTITFNQISMTYILDIYNSLDPSYHQDYIFDCDMQSNNNTLTINNLVIKNSTFGYNETVDGIANLGQLDGKGTLILKNAVFENIHIYALRYSFATPNLEIYNCTFSNIEMWKEDYWDWDQIAAFIYIDNGGFIIKDCHINNLYFWDIHFLISWQNKQNQNYQLIQNCIFDFSGIYDVLSFSHIINEFNWVLDETYSLFYFQYGKSNMGEISVFINDTSFIDCINILHLDDRCHLSASLNNVYITVSYFSSYDLINVDRALIMVTETAIKMDINDNE